MTDELCAREGCGAPKAWHDRGSTVGELYQWNNRDELPLVNLYRSNTACFEQDCDCRAYLAPKPPEPERQAWVVELDAAYEWAMGDRVGFVPLAAYLAAHSQPAPALCICGGRQDEHEHELKCWHTAKYMNKRGMPAESACYCNEYRAAQP